MNFVSGYLTFYTMISYHENLNIKFRISCFIPHQKLMGNVLKISQKNSEVSDITN
jgi:hypothetical protein